MRHPASRLASFIRAGEHRRRHRRAPRERVLPVPISAGRAGCAAGWVFVAAVRSKSA